MWTWHDALELASLLLTPLLAGVGCWWAMSLKLQRTADRLDFHETRIDELRADVDYAHRRLNELPCRRHEPPTFLPPPPVLS